jgi:N-acetylmuramic acid 6-phosphate etherase
MEKLESRGHLLTEQINPESHNLDSLSSLEIVDLFNQEDAKTLKAIAESRIELAAAIEAASKAISQGGRLFYIGAGTSGRLGVLDAAECPPTFCTSPELVQGIIAGGAGALIRSSESLEDRPEDGASAIAHHQITSLDVVIGITAGGTTPYATTIAMSCVPQEQVPIDVDVDIRLLVGAEILAGSTRLKAGTVTKMALNIISTGTMVRLGKVYGNRMIDVSVTNTKLRDRAIRIICDLTSLNRQQAEELLQRSKQKVLEKTQGNLRLAVQQNLPEIL